MPTQPNCPWIRVDDFVETSVWVSFENSTTQTHLRSDEKVELGELLEAGLSLKITEEFSVTAKVLESEDAEDGFQSRHAQVPAVPQSQMEGLPRGLRPPPGSR